MKASMFTLILMAGLCVAGSLTAQVPQHLNYHGGVALGGTAFHGLAYFKFALVSREGTQSFWSNDGTSTAGAEPEKGLPLIVYRGSYEVTLGDTSFTNMVAVPPTVFTHPDVHLRVWFSEDNTTFHKVERDMPITAVGYAMVAATVPDGAVTSAKLAQGAVTAGKLGANAVTAINLAPGSVWAEHLRPNATALNLQASGALIMSDQPNATNLLQAGFVNVGSVQANSDQWTSYRPFTLSPRTNAVAAWVGNNFMVWGGVDAGRRLADGARYDPLAETWTPVAPVALPVSYTSAKGIWTGEELLLFTSVPTQHRRCGRESESGVA